ncbi:MAG: protein kinase [Myxococcota bacterium]
MSSESADSPESLSATVAENNDDSVSYGSLVRALAAAPPVAVDRRHLAPGSVIGGFRVEKVLGAGAMGVVYEAFDPNLDRRVALKLHAKTGDDAQTSRMWREAKAMARLSHPNVIAVHEVGEHEGQVFIAMELVEGGTVRDWLAQAPPGSTRPWREVVRVFLEAAEGLAAAHAAMMVHRDFKPANILMGRDGRVRVADFGLARAAFHESETVTDPSRDPVQDPDRPPVLTDRLTQTGAVVGTPAYMAPEQLRAEEVDHRSDQFSFCVALYEALYGARPYESRLFATGDPTEHDLHPRPPPADTDVPGWVHAVVVRGLSLRPPARFASMHDLVVALRADPSVRRRRIAWGVGVVATLGLAVGVTYQASVGDPPCRTAADPIASVWSPDVAATVDRALRETGSPLAAGASERVRPVLDEYAQAWGRQRVEACRATRLRGEQSESMLDRRMVCLDRRRQQLEAVVGVLSSPDPEVIENTNSVLETLGTLDACADLESLQAQVPLPEDASTREAVERVRARLVTVEAEARAGRARQMRGNADSAVDDAAALGFPPLRAQAHFARYLVHHGLTERPPALADAVAAHRWATEGGDARGAWRAAVAVAEQIGQTPPERDDALRWLETAEGWSRRFEMDLSDYARASRVRANVLQRGDRIADAVRELEDSLAHLEDHGASLALLAPHRVGLAYLLFSASRFDQARAQIHRGIEQLGVVYGDDHPELANAYIILATIQDNGGDFEVALAAVEHGLSIWRAISGEGSVAYAEAMRVRGDTLTSLGRYEPAIEDYERALEILVGVEHRKPEAEVATLANLASALSAKGDWSQAVATSERTLHRALEVYGAGSIDVASIRLNYGSHLSVSGEDERAAEQMSKAIERFEVHLGSTALPVGIARYNLAALYSQGLKDYEQADEQLSLAQLIFSEHFPSDHVWHARVAMIRATLLEGQGRVDDAVSQWRDAVERISAVPDANASDVVWAHYRLGRVLVMHGELRAAIEPLEEALRMGERMGLTAVKRGHRRYFLGRALWSLPARRAEARAMVKSAIHLLEAEQPTLVRQARRWLRRHGGA